jgi:Tfp pilus assembly protein PilV
MKYFRLKNSRQAGFTLIEIILSIVFAAIIGVVFLTYMGTQLTQSGDPVHITRHEGMAEMWMERIIADYVQEMNTPATYTTALANIMARDYTTGIYNMPASVTLTRNYVTYDAGGNETVLAGGATSTNLKVTVGAGGHSVTSILTAQRTTSGDPITYF